MKRYLPWIALPLLLVTLIWAHRAHTMDQSLVQSCYRALLPEAESFTPLTGTTATAQDASGATLAYVGVSSHLGYGGPMLVGIVVRPDGSLGAPVIFTHKETQAYLNNIEQQGFFRQFESLRVDAALTPGFDVDAVSGATLSSHAIALSVNEIAHTVAAQALQLTPKKAEMPWRIGVHELLIAALFALGLLASTVKKLARYRLFLLGGSIVILGFWLNRSFSVAYVLAACMGFFPDITQNPGWYIVLAGVLLPPLILGKNPYCTFVCPFCGVQELTHTISHVNLATGPLLKIARILRTVFLFAALFIGFLTLNPSSASYEPFGTIFGMNGESWNWNLLFVMLVASFFFHRFWCHVFCPAGALLDFVASKRRDAGKKLRRKKNCPAHGTPCAARAAAPRDIPAMSKETADAPVRKITKSRLLFVLFYATGLVCIVWTVWENMNAQ